MVVARHYVIDGRVQAVGFRFFVEQAAHREGLSGFVRNTDDGKVETQVEGERDAVERFERAIRRGPPAARVDNVDVTDVAPTGRQLGFMVRG